MKYFKYEEFDSPDVKGSGINMHPAFLEKLDALREATGIPLKINSGFRTKKWNEKVGGVNGSAHTKGLACDIECLASHTRFLIVRAALMLGIKRIETSGGTWVHIDIDEELPQEVLF